jgi:hypothetical protein
MDFGEIAQTIADQFVTVWNAPVPFLGVCVALWFLLRWHIRGQFETRLANAYSTIEMLEKQIDRGQAKAALTEQGQNVPPPPELAPRDISVRAGDDGEEAIVKYTALYISHTKLQAAEIIRKYYGDKLTITGIVNNVTPTHSKKIMLALDIKDKITFCIFSKVTERLKHLNKGDKITVSGTVSSIDSLGVAISDCELL